MRTDHQKVNEDMLAYMNIYDEATAKAREGLEMPIEPPVDQAVAVVDRGPGFHMIKTAAGGTLRVNNQVEKNLNIWFTRYDNIMEA